MIRIQRSRKKGYKQPENTLYCGRGSKFGNPFIIKESAIEDVWYVTYHPKFNSLLIDSLLYDTNFSNIFIFTNRETKELALQDCLKCFEVYAENYLIDKLHLLKGKNLSCWCAIDQPCHVDILIKLYNKYYSPTEGN